jgi:pantetheine-phosphate adenylyltransferase
VDNVEFDVNSGLVAEYARQKGARVLVKGLRAVSDYEQEVQMAIINSKINPDLDTIFFPSSEKYTYLSSSVAKEMARYNADLSEFLPREILEDVKKKLTEK